MLRPGTSKKSLKSIPSGCATPKSMRLCLGFPEDEQRLKVESCCATAITVKKTLIGNIFFIAFQKARKLEVNTLWNDYDTGSGTVVLIM
jgi:hypothetical protein